ncbi:hypothetical protein CQW23_16797 [Capsicum baccatum]|uniref:Kinesin motor domain-containing protein n=1 Tax=Capsicum baccatum TaxID=33114 RepID=A0A2G2WC45_CAPBA|nr:hypothetical protein CQW23_16797 [Capsicum baccatum]
MRANELLFRLNDKVVRFDICKAMKQPSDMDVFSVAYEDKKALSVKKHLTIEPLSAALLNVEHEDDEDYEELMGALTRIRSYSHTPKQLDLDLTNQPSPTAKTSSEEPPMLESKELPDYLRYVFLESRSILPVSVADDLSEQHVEALISALMRYKRAMGRKIDDIIGIPPGICTHKSHLEEDCMPTTLHTQYIFRTDVPHGGPAFHAAGTDLALENLCDNFDQAVTISGDDLMKASSSIPNGSVQHEFLKNQYDEECELLKKKYLEECTERKHRSTSMVEFDPSYENELLISCVGSSKKQFKFDYLFKLEDIQDIVFAQTMPIVTFVLDGYNVYIFTYGQTGTWKIFTMEGAPENRGVNY